MRRLILLIVLVHIGFVGFTQQMGYQIWGIHQKAAHQDQLVAATTLSHINLEYPKNWIAPNEYISTRITKDANGIITEAHGTGYLLSDEQQALFNRIKLGTLIKIEVKYYSQNAATREKEVNTMQFSRIVIPTHEATFVGGYEEMKKYLQTTALQQIEKEADDFELATIKFTVDENGKAVNVRLSVTTQEKWIDDLLIKAVMDMPLWQPASDDQGAPVSQDFEISVGKMIDC